MTPIPRQVRVVLAVLALPLLLPQCQRQQPSPEFARAHELFARLYGAKLEKAYRDPQMSEVEQLLEQVPKNSLDAADAKALLKRIREGRAKLAEEEAKVQATVKDLTAPVPYARMESPAPIARDAGPPEAADAGPEMPQRGMARSEFTGKFSQCFSQWQSVALFEQGQNKGMVDSWELKNIANCRDLYPGFVQTLVLTNDQAVVATVPRSALELRPVDGGAPTGKQGER